jgi:ankyrin repeat protein
VNARSSDGRTALMLASESLGQRIECVRALREAGADPTIRDNDGLTAAQRMRTSQDPELLGLLK